MPVIYTTDNFPLVKINILFLSHRESPLLYHFIAINVISNTIPTKVTFDNYTEGLFVVYDYECL